MIAPGTRERVQVREQQGESAGTIYEEMVDDYRFNGRGDSDIPCIETFRQAWNKHPSLSHVRMAKDKRNFQGCPQCIALKAEIRRAQQAGDKAAWAAARARLAAHRDLQRRERMVYYHRRHCTPPCTCHQPLRPIPPWLPLSSPSPPRCSRTRLAGPSAQPPHTPTHIPQLRHSHMSCARTPPSSKAHGAE